MKKSWLCLIVSLIMIAGLCGCGNKSAEADKTTVRVGAMAGPTAMGMVELMKKSDDGSSIGQYEFAELATDASALVAPISSGELDIAAVPANLASVIYNNTEGSIQVIAACSLGVLNLVERGDEISSLSDLAGKTIYATGQGAVPEYTIRYLLSASGVNPDSDVTIQWCADTTEALSYVKSMDKAVAVLPQPFVTAACAQVDDLRVVADLNEEWNKINPEDDILTGVIVVRKQFADEHPAAVKTFIDEYSSSVEFVQTNTDAAAALIAEYGIVGSEQIAKKALPGCHVVCIMGEELQHKLDAFLNIIYEMNPKAVGGKLPSSDFVYGL